MIKREYDKEALQILKEGVQRIENITREIKALQNEKKELVKNLKSQGFDTKALNKAIKDVKYKKEHPDEAQLAEFYERKIEDIVQ